MRLRSCLSPEPELAENSILSGLLRLWFRFNNAMRKALGVIGVTTARSRQAFLEGRPFAGRSHALDRYGHPEDGRSLEAQGQGCRNRDRGRDLGIGTAPVGSHLVIDEDTNFLGSVSGGCVEGAVITEALDVIADGKPRMIEFGVADETAWQVGLSCGGRIRVYVERVD